MSGHVQDLLSAYLDGELSPPERGMVEAHLAACEECAAQIEDFAAVDAALRELPVEAPAEYFDTFTQRVRERVRAGAAPKGRRPVPAWTWAAAAALLLAVLTPLTLRQAPAPGGLTAPAPVEPLADAEAKSGRAGRPPRASTARPAAPPAPPKAAARMASEKPDEPPTRAEAPVDAGFAAPLEATDETDVVAETRTEQAAGATPASRDEALRLAAPPAAAAPPAGPAARSDEARQRAVETQREQEDGDTRAAPDKGRAGLAEGVLGGAGARGTTSVPVRKQAVAAEDEFALLRARGKSGASVSADSLRALRDDWRGFAARNPTGARGDEARWQVIETGYRAFKLSGEAHDRDVLARDARTYLERGDGTHNDRARAILAEIERE